MRAMKYRQWISGSLFVLGMVSLGGVSTSEAQDSAYRTTQTQDDGDNGTDWGWVGLLGLAGLLGLRKRDHVRRVDHVDTTTRTRV
jgi:MYXO-CTERM domain-containing protein